MSLYVHIKYRPMWAKQHCKLFFYLQIDTIIINYVRHPDTIKKIKHLVRALKIKRPFILCGICTEEGLVNIDEILKVQKYYLNKLLNHPHLCLRPASMYSSCFVRSCSLRR